jgi:type I restriction enzyme M protein
MPSRKPERHTETHIERIMVELGFDRSLFGYQRALDDDVQALLPSKETGALGIGKPEIAYRLGPTEVLLVECKRDAKDHASKTVAATGLFAGVPLEAKKYAEDGVIAYMRGVRQKFACIGVAVSGTSRSSLRISVFRAYRGGEIERLDMDRVPSPAECAALLRPTRTAASKTIDDCAEELHNFLRDEMELSEQEKPLLVSAVLLALEVDSFRRSYREYDDGEELAKEVLAKVEWKLKKDKLSAAKITAMMTTYAFIGTNKPLRDHIRATIEKIDEEIRQFAKNGADAFDLLGQFYGEFLKYSGGDKKGLGIVLTPLHIASLFVRMASVDRNTVLLDTCTGTAGFLITGMADMFRSANGDEACLERIKNAQLIGIEFNDRMFTLACANMLLRGDGKSNMFFGSCFDPKIGLRINPSRVQNDVERTERLLRDAETQLAAATTKKQKKDAEARLAELRQRRIELHQALASPDGDALPRLPDVAILNPPYAKKSSDKNELAFIYEACSLLRPGGTCIAIVPLSCASDDSATGVEWKRRLMEEHTLEAVISMPEQLFPGVGVVTCAIVFTAHRPHRANHKTWLALWKDDGFVLRKGRRIEATPWHDYPSDDVLNPEMLPGTESRLLAEFRERIEAPQRSLRKALGVSDEWCAEAHLEPDYSLFNTTAVEHTVKQYLLHLLQKDEVISE